MFLIGMQLLVAGFAEGVSVNASIWSFYHTLLGNTQSNFWICCVMLDNMIENLFLWFFPVSQAVSSYATTSEYFRN